MQKICAVSGQPFEISDEDLAFYKKMGIITDTDLRGLPTLCPEERQRRRLAWRNEWTLYHRNCDATGKKIISIYRPDIAFPVYENAYWWSDAWDAKKFGRDFDFGRSFFEQFAELLNVVPQPSQFLFLCENCDFCNAQNDSKNCYLTFGSGFLEDCMYSNSFYYGNNTLDTSFVQRIQWSYELVNCNKVYGSLFCQNTSNSSECFFCYECHGCQNCFGCVGLRNKQYYIFNEKFSKEEYHKRITLLQKDPKTVRIWFEKNKLRFPRKSCHQISCENSSGNYLVQCNNVQESYDTEKTEDSKFLAMAISCSNAYDLNHTGYNKWCNECITGGYHSQGSFIVAAYRISESFYCIACHNIANCFGCIGLRNAQYCIFNKQYTKEEYEKLVPKIIEHMKNTPLTPALSPQGARGQRCEWGEFFPMELSPFGYNETVAMEYFPLSPPLDKGEMEGIMLTEKTNPPAPLYQGGVQYNWAPEKISAQYDGPKYEIPDNINDVKDEILDKILTCEISGKHYRIIKPELEFYRKMNLPIPRLCPDERHKQRMALRNPRKLWKRNCADCECEIQTTFSPERPEKVLCDRCYLKVVE